MTETTARIRWTAGAEASMTAYFGLVANCGQHLFQIFKPAFKGDQHTLRSELPGQRYSQRDGDPDTLKAEAERWLAGFVSSLGAGYPGEREHVAASLTIAWADIGQSRTDLNLSRDRKPLGRFNSVFFEPADGETTAATAEEKE